MREYKFRVWDNHDQCWLNSFAIFYNGEFADMAKGVMHGDICQCDINYQKTPSHIIIEQFTGLHDKNGVEIYEGDILSDGDLSTRVYWNYTEAGFTNGVCDWRKLLPHLEVIGNIHEEVVE